MIKYIKCHVVKETKEEPKKEAKKIDLSVPEVKKNPTLISCLYSLPYYAMVEVLKIEDNKLSEFIKPMKVIDCAKECEKYWCGGLIVVLHNYDGIKDLYRVIVSENA